jgi:hypothetical protein
MFRSSWEQFGALMTPVPITDRNWRYRRLLNDIQLTSLRPANFSRQLCITTVLGGEPSSSALSPVQALSASMDARSVQLSVRKVALSLWCPCPSAASTKRNQQAGTRTLQFDLRTTASLSRGQRTRGRGVPRADRRRERLTRRSIPGDGSRGCRGATDPASTLGPTSRR